MSNFDSAIPIIFKHEGLFVNNPNDPGGATKYGISLRYLKCIGDLNGDGFLDGDFDFDGDVDIDDIRNMTEEQAKNLYRINWWEKYNYSRILDQVIAVKVFDFSVNMGAKQSHLLLQRALWSVYGVNSIVIDGILGEKTLKAINASLSARQILCAYRSEAAGFYRLLISKNPKFKEFENGWLNRAYD